MKEKFKKFYNSILPIIMVIVVVMNVTQFHKSLYINREYKQLKSVTASTKDETLRNKIDSLFEFYDTHYYETIEDKEKHVDNMIRAFQITTEDKYSVYIDKEDMIMEEREITGEYHGIGIVMEGSPEGEDYSTITLVQENAPAHEAGIEPGMKLYKINDVAVKTEEFSELLKEVTQGNVKTIILETDKGEFIVSPRVIDYQTVYVKYEDDIAVITITQFIEKSSDEFRKVMDDIEKNKNIKGLLFDLRNNGGGDKDAVTKMVDRLAPKGLMYSEKYKTYTDEVHSDATHTALPIAILGNGGSASASELFIMTLQDTNDAVLIGETTYGKSTILTYLPFDDGTAMMISSGFYYPPSDRFIEGVGITPDIEDKENPYETAMEYLKNKIKTES